MSEPVPGNIIVLLVVATVSLAWAFFVTIWVLISQGRLNLQDKQIDQLRADVDVLLDEKLDEE